MPDYDRKKPIPFLSRPWIIETIVFFLVAYQESFRLSSRTAHKLLPVSKQIQDYYYFNFGDFVNGYIIAFIADGLINFLVIKSASSYKLFGLQITKRTNALFSTLFSAVIIVLFELSQSGSTTSDIMDIPAGIAGALLFCLTRLVALKISESYSQHL
jgi:hypothetical protein